jgi:hypothetical protein
MVVLVLYAYFQAMALNTESTFCALWPQKAIEHSAFMIVQRSFRLFPVRLLVAP